MIHVQICFHNMILKHCTLYYTTHLDLACQNAACLKQELAHIYARSGPDSGQAHVLYG